MMVPAAIRKVPRVTLMFWAIDPITKPHGEGGLELCRITSSLVIAAVMAVMIVVTQGMNMSSRVVLGLLIGGSLVAGPSARGASDGYTVTMLALPGASPAGISIDFIAFDPATGFIWVPAGNTGAVDVVDTATRKVRQVSGFATAEMGSGERKRVVGPSAVSPGHGTVYVGSRGDLTVCALNARTLERGTCHRLDSMPDGVAYVADTNEVWVTTPRDKSIRILDAATLDEKAKLTFDGNPEGFAVDAKRGRFYTNMEDEDLTLAIDLKSHERVATWKPACGKDGPHGLRVDEQAGHLFVACSARAEVLDAAHDGAVLSSIDTGDGVDDIDYSPAKHPAVRRCSQGRTAHHCARRRARHAVSRRRRPDPHRCAEPGRHDRPAPSTSLTPVSEASVTSSSSR